MHPSIRFTRFQAIAILFWAGGASLTPLQAQSGDTLTVETAIRLAVQNHPAVQQAQQSLLASQARIDQSRSPLWPEVKAEALYSRLGPAPEISMPFGTFQLAPENVYNVHVLAREIAYDFGRLRTGMELAQSNQQAAVIGVEGIQSNLAYRTIEAFYASLFLRQNLQVIDEQIAALQQHLDLTQKKVQTGSATDFDVLTTSVRVSSAQTRRIEVANLFQRQENLLRQLTGLAPDQALRLSGNFVTDSSSLAADSLMAVAWQQLPEVKLAQNAETQSEVRLRLVSLGLKPSLAVNLDLGLKNGYPDNLNALKANWIGGLQLQWPLFNGYLTRYQRQEAQANLEAVRAHTRDLERQTQTNVIQAVADVRANWDKVQASRAPVEQAHQAVALAEARYAAGVATNLDLLDAQTALADVELTHLKAQYDLKMSIYNLKKAVGEKVW